MRQLKPNDIALIFGKGAQGKTTLGHALVMAWLQSHDDRVVILDPAGGWVKDDKALFDWGEYYWPMEFPYIVRIDADSEAELLFSNLIQSESNFLLVVDELQYFANPYRISEPLKRLATYGRNKSITFLGITRKPHLSNNVLTDNYTAIYCYRMLQPSEILYMSNLTGADCTFLRNLPEHKYAVFED